MSTNKLTATEIRRSWHLIDAKNQPLGRLSTNVATVLMGKNKPNYVPYLDNGDNVVVVNAAKVAVSGKKEDQKLYRRHSGYPGGMREQTLSQVRAQKPENLVTHAVKGMIPKNKLGRQMIKKLHVFPGNEHSFKDKFKEQDKEQNADK